MKSSDSFENDPVVKQAHQNSNFRAVKVLVETENTLRVAHNRIKVLEANEVKNTHKIHNQLQTIEKIQRAREAENAHVTLVEEGKSQFEKHLSQISLRSKMMKSDHMQKKEEAFNEIKQQRKLLYRQTSENSEAAEKAISTSKQKEYLLKESNRIHISKEEEQCKKRLIKFYENKQSRIKENKVGEIEFLRTKEAGKQKRLQELGRIEMELINKQSQSQAAYLEVKQKLDSLLNSVKQKNMRSKQSLKPSMHISQPPPSY